MSEDERLKAVLRERSRELCKDFPHTDDPFDDLWALTSAVEGTSMACDDLHLLLAAANERIAQLERMVKHEAEDWSECDNALEKAGVVMNPDGYRKSHVEAVEELGARIAKLTSERDALNAEAIADKLFDEFDDDFFEQFNVEGRYRTTWTKEDFIAELSSIIVSMKAEALTPKE